MGTLPSLRTVGNSSTHGPHNRAKQVKVWQETTGKTAEKSNVKSNVDNGTGRREAECTVCGMKFLTARSHTKTCSARCRKREAFETMFSIRVSIYSIRVSIYLRDCSNGPPATILHSGRVVTSYRLGSSPRKPLPILPTSGICWRGPAQ